MSDETPPELSADERLLLAAFEKEVAQARPVTLTIGWEVAWAILGTIQLACRHPGFPAQTRAVAEGFARHLEKQIVLGPASTEIATKGWEAPTLGEEDDAASRQGRDGREGEEAEGLW